jgi:hypothetical protein
MAQGPYPVASSVYAGRSWNIHDFVMAVKYRASIICPYENFQASVAVPNAGMTITNTRNGNVRAVKSDSDGLHLAVSLPLP